MATPYTNGGGLLMSLTNSATNADDAVNGFTLFCLRHHLVLDVKNVLVPGQGYNAEACIRHKGEPVSLFSKTNAMASFKNWRCGVAYLSQRPSDKHIIEELLQTIEPHEGRVLSFGKPTQFVTLPNLGQLYRDEQIRPIVPTEVDF